MEEGELLFRQQYDLTTELARVAVDREDLRTLQSIPGLVYPLALAIVAALGDVRRFPNRKKFAAYCGLVPRNQQSGEVNAPQTRRRKRDSLLTWAFEIAVPGLLKDRWDLLAPGDPGRFRSSYQPFAPRPGFTLEEEAPGAT